MKRFYYFCLTLFTFFSTVLSAEEADGKYWGYHLILDCKGCSLESVTNSDVIASFVKELVQEIDMVSYGDPTIVHFAEHTPEAAGFSLVQLIETSAITGHFVDCSGDAYLDIFSCKEYDIEKAMAVVKKYFEPEKIQTHFLKRQAR